MLTKITVCIAILSYVSMTIRNINWDCAPCDILVTWVPPIGSVQLAILPFHPPNYELTPSSSLKQGDESSRTKMTMKNAIL
jgi:hypothetical protein